MSGSLNFQKIKIGDLEGCRVLGRDELEPLIRQVASRLRDAGAGPGEVVLYQGPQQASAVVLFWACMLNGAIFAACDEDWPAFQLENATGGMSPRLVASTSRSVAAAHQVFPNAEHLWLEPAPEFTDLEGLANWAKGATPCDALTIPDAAPAAYLFTSGTSGVPKAVVHSRGGLAHGARLTLKAFEWKAGERLINLAEPHTMSGLRNAFLAAPLGGVEWIPVRRQSLFTLLDQLDQAQCHRLVVGPLLLRQLALLGDRAPADAFASLKAIYFTGATLDPSSVETVHARLGIPVVNYYGLTETGGICLSQRLPGWRPGDATLGHAAGCEARVVAANGVVAADGEEGELQIRSPQLMLGYLNNPQATAERLQGDWLRTGDIVRQATDGRFELVGRASQFIKTLSSDRVHPEEIEQVLERHSAVAEAAVFGRPEAGGGERIAALIVARPDEGDTEDLPALLADFVANHLGSARRPSMVRVVKSLPRLGNGKLIRHRLQDLDE